jgi:hypothetical protein
MDANEVIGRTKDKLRRVEKEYDDLDEQQTTLLRSATDVDRHKRTLETLEWGLNKFVSRSQQIGLHFVGNRKMSREEATIERHTNDLLYDKTIVGQLLRDAEKEKQ